MHLSGEQMEKRNCSTPECFTNPRQGIITAVVSVDIALFRFDLIMMGRLCHYVNITFSSLRSDSCSQGSLTSWIGISNDFGHGGRHEETPRHNTTQITLLSPDVGVFGECCNTATILEFYHKIPMGEISGWIVFTECLEGKHTEFDVSRACISKCCRSRVKREGRVWGISQSWIAE